jgi:hypothetical protein
MNATVFHQNLQQCNNIRWYVFLLQAVVHWLEFLKHFNALPTSWSFFIVTSGFSSGKNKVMSLFGSKPAQIAQGTHLFQQTNKLQLPKDTSRQASSNRCQGLTDVNAYDQYSTIAHAIRLESSSNFVNSMWSTQLPQYIHKYLKWQQNWTHFVQYS